MVNRLSYGFENDLIELDNEPGFLSPFIFSHCDRPDMAAKYVDFIRTNHFSLAKGYPDNEDSGAMGSWYIFTSIGFFPNAGQDYYYLLPPAFPEVTLTMENGKKIEVKTIKSSPDAKYIQSVVLNTSCRNSRRCNDNLLFDESASAMEYTTFWYGQGRSATFWSESCGCRVFP